MAPPDKNPSQEGKEPTSRGRRPQGDRPWKRSGPPRDRDSRPYDRDRSRGDHRDSRDRRPQADRPRDDRPQGDRPWKRSGPPKDRDSRPYDRDRSRPYDRDRSRGDHRDHRDSRDRRPQADRPRDERPQGDRPWKRSGPPRDRDSRPYDRDRSRPYDRGRDRGDHRDHRDSRDRRPQGERPQGDRPWKRSGPPRDRDSRPYDRDRSRPYDRDRSRGRGDHRDHRDSRDRRPSREHSSPSWERSERSDPTWKLVATCSLGLELSLGRELEALECGPISRDNAQVSFPYSPANLARANTWLRTADRVWLQLLEFPCGTSEELFQGVKSVNWPELLPQDARFPIEVITTQSALASVPNCQRVAKKALVDSLQATYGSSRLPETGADFAVRIFIVRDRARLFLDTSGEGLHRRGYKTYNAEAPLRETVAAALVLLSHWNADRELYDPLCGSGTILLEAAYIGLNRAPGLERSFASQRWDWLGKEVWAEAYREAQDLMRRRQHLKLYGSDRDGRVLKLAQRHLNQAGLQGSGIHFQKREVADFSSQRKYGVLITNPPYGHRLSDRNEVVETTRMMASVFEPLHETWYLSFLTAFPDFVEHYGREPARTRKLYNGRIACQLLQYPGPKPPARPSLEGNEGGSERIIKRIPLDP